MMDSPLRGEAVGMDVDGDEKPLIIDTGEHNHLQLLLLVNELKEHNSRSDSLLTKTAYYIKEQVCYTFMPDHWWSP